MPRPGTDVVITDGSGPGGPSLNTGQAFFVGKTATAGAPSQIHSLKQYVSTYGPRTGGDKLHDAVNAFFQEGGGTAFISPTPTEDAAGVADALDAFEYELGPGQVAAPGLTDPTVHAKLLSFVDATHRVALLDSAGGDQAALDAEATALHDAPGARFAALLAPALSYPDPATGVPVNVAYSGVQAGIQARSDLLGNPNRAAAGANGVSRLALGLAEDYSDVDREALNEAGVTLAKLVYGDVRTYGARTVAGPDDTNWLWFPNSRVVMAITHEADAIAQTYLFQQIDGRRQLFAAFETDLRGMLLNHFNAGALYGSTPAEAFAVDTGTQVNTIETISAGEVHAVIRIKTSPSAEWVRIEIVKVPLDVPIAA
jgi:hypothetical protein